MKTLVSAAAVAAIAGSAFGLGETLDRTNAPIYSTNTPGISITATPLHGADRGPLAGFASSVYGWDDTSSTISGSGFVAAPASSYLGFQGYSTTLGTPPAGTPSTDYSTFTAMSFQFVGGVTNTGEILWFDFLYNDVTLGNYFGIQFPSGGNFLWTITFDPTGFVVPTEGYLQITSNTDPNIGPVGTGRWFASDLGAMPEYGTAGASSAGSFDYGSGSVPLGYAWAIATPTPGTVGLMGLAGLAGVSRRRRR